ncbi:MAG TPA: cyclic nucleotide-binding domain-containing protein [bacterium]|nr:cyclic nucleotide-binding domain-containing protein [bacterium]
MKIAKNAKVSTFLKEVNLFEGLDNQTLNRIFRLGYVQNYRKGDLIIREGEHGGNLHILINGKAEVLTGKAGKKKKSLSKIGRGSIFGEMSVFDGAPYSASVRAVDNCDVHIMRGSDFLSFLKSNPAVGVDVLATLISSISNRLRRANLALASIHQK